MKINDHSALPKGRDIPFLLLGVIGIGTSGPIVAKSTMPVPTLIFWRNLGGAIVMAPFAFKKAEWREKSKHRPMKLAGFAGILLALHFLGFFGAMRFTSVATGTALASLQPIFAAIYLRIKGASINRLALLGMFVAFGSLLFITGIDFTISRRSFIGDLFAITSGALSAAYILIGSNAQKEIATSTYTTICFTSCAITVLPIILISGSGLINFGKGQWLLLGILIIGAQFLGHTLFNFTLKRISPVVVSLIVFFEVPVAALVALLWLHQKLPFGILPGIIGLMTGCAIFIVGGRRR